MNHLREYKFPKKICQSSKMGNPYKKIGNISILGFKHLNTCWVQSSIPCQVLEENIYKLNILIGALILVKEADMIYEDLSPSNFVCSVLMS